MLDFEGCLVVADDLRYRKNRLPCSIIEFFHEAPICLLLVVFVLFDLLFRLFFRQGGCIR